MNIKEKLAAMKDEEKTALMEKIAAEGSAEAAVKMLAADGIEATAEELTGLFKQEKPASVGEISDEELDNVSGGRLYYKFITDKDTAKLPHIFRVGDIVEVYTCIGFSTVQCRITMVGWEPASTHTILCDEDDYCDVYYCEAVESHWYFTNGYRTRDEIEFGSKH